MDLLSPLSAEAGRSFTDFWSGLRFYIVDLDFGRYPLALVDIILVAVVFYWIYKFLSGTRGSRILAGFILLGLIMIIGQILGLTALNWLLRILFAAFIVAVPVIFQPELRRALERIGRPRIITRTKRLVSRETVEIIGETVSALARGKTGAIIVFERGTGLAEFWERATLIDGKVSTELLLSIFRTGAPLHDGAVVIRGDRIIAASVILPLADEARHFPYGTRHRAAIGITEVSDALSVVISEERGVISLVQDGKIEEKISVRDLKDKLTTVLQ